MTVNRDFKVAAILAAHNEERFIGGAIEHLHDHGVGVYVIDNESTDRTRAIAETYVGRGVIGVESFSRPGYWAWTAILTRKEELSRSLDADWFMHVDADEIHVPPASGRMLADALADVDAAGFEAVNFAEFTFLPTVEEPDHDHPAFRRTMRSYYPFLPFSPHLVRAWKKTDRELALARTGGHHAVDGTARIYPERFPMKHYIFLSLEHAMQKFVRRDFDPAEVARGWFNWRAKITASSIRLPSAKELRQYSSDDALDASNPRVRHYLQEMWERDTG